MELTRIIARIAASLIVASLSLASAAAAAAAPAGGADMSANGSTRISDEQRKAALAAGRLMEWQQAVATGCTGYLDGEVDTILPLLSYFWHADELKHIMIKELVWPAISEAEKAESMTYAHSVQSKLSAASDPVRLKVCNSLVGSFLIPASHLEGRSPDDAKVLDTMFDAHPELLPQWRAEERMAGCVKYNFNVGARVLEMTKSMCACEMNAAFPPASEKERRILPAPPVLGWLFPGREMTCPPVAGPGPRSFRDPRPLWSWHEKT